MSSSSSSSSPVPFIPNIPVPWPPHVSLPPEDGPCDCPPCESGEGGSSSGPEDGGGAKLPPANDVVSGSGGVRLYDGKIVLGSPVALTSRGFNVPFGTQLDYNSTGLGANIGFGKNWVSTGALGGLYFGSGYVLYKQGANSIKYFYPTSGGDYATTYFVRDRLFKYDPGTPSLVTYTLTAPDGTVQIFNNAGKLTSFRDAYGNTATVAYDANGNLQSVAMTSGSESFQYDYTWSSPTGGNVTFVVFSVNGYAVRRAGYAYAGGLLKGIELRDNTAAAGVSPAWSTGTVENCVFTYNSSDLLLHVIPPVVYRQMVNNSIPNPAALDPAVPADLAVLNAYAETEYAYNGSGLVSTMYTRGRNYNYAFDYTTVTRAGTSLNVWCAKTVVTRPDGSKLNVYFNRGGQVMLQQVEDPATGKVWNRLYRQFQEGTGRVVLAAGSDAITVVNPASQWLVTLDSTLGRVEVFSYDGVGNLQYHGLQQGTSLHKLVSYTYQVQSVSGQGSIWRTATKTVYTGENSSGAVTSTYAFTYYTGTFQISQKTVTLPVIATGQNGTGLTFTQVRNFDTQGFLTSSVDEMGVTAAYDYYKSRAALKQVRRDTTGLNLTTDYEVDYFGRTTLVLGPAHSIDLNGTATSIRRAQWTYYKDVEGEQWTFGGYKKVTGGATQVVGPVTVTRPNLAPPSSTYAGYRQALRFDAVYSSAGIPSPTYSFAQTTWVRRTLGLYNQAGKLAEEWNYFLIPSSGYGTQSTHYGKKLFAYNTAGRLNQTTCAGGTVDKTTFNPVGWPVQEELGTSAGLSVTRVNEFNDNGTLKKATLPVDSTSSNDRITEYAYDWRMRLEKEWTTVNLDAGATVQLATYGYDNQGQVTLTESYHTAVGSGNRTGSQSAAYDDLGNLYQRTTYAVDSAGATGNSLVDNWFRDGMGRVVRSAPAGTQHAYLYDQLGRFTADSASSFGSGIDSTINKLENGYNNRGLLIRATSFNTSGGTVNNEIKWAYNDFSQPVTEYQEHTGAVNTSTSLKVQYGYANGSANTIRPTGLTSPDGSAVSWDYVSSLAGALSRPDAVKESSGSVTLATFKFLGIGMQVSLKYDAASNAEWTIRNGASSGDAGDVYTGLDRFGRMVETIWQAGSTELVHTTYGRNRVGGVTWQRNVLAHAMTGSPLPPERLQQDNFYWYDGLQQNYQHQRGDLAGTAPNYTGITNLQQTEIRSFDETGNWLSNYTSSPALTQSRTHNKANEIATISGITAPTFDGTGNMKTMPKPGAWSTTCTLTWDAWNRLITCTDGTTTTNNRYDALTRRIRKSITGGEVRDYYYDKQWRSIEERLSGTFSGPDKTRHVWSPFDRWTLIRRQRETAGTLTDTHFCLKDYLDPTALITPAAAVVERFSYDAFGPVRFMNAAFVTQSSSSYAWTFLFHGEFIDTESGLYNYGYRFYYASLGRWLSRDPIEEVGGGNNYRFLKNNDLNFIDIFGLDAYDDVAKEIDAGGREALKQAKEDLIKRKKNHTTGEMPNEIYEFGGRICRKCTIGPDGRKTYSYYRTGPVTQSNSGVFDPTLAPPCNDNDQTVGVYHNHPNGTGLSGFDPLEENEVGTGDKKVAEKGKSKREGKEVPDDQKIPPRVMMGATSEVSRNFHSATQTDIYNPRLPSNNPRNRFKVFGPIP